MGQVIGAKEYKIWQKNGSLTLKESVLANCYMCNGLEKSSEDCGCLRSCPLYAYSPYGRKINLHLGNHPIKAVDTGSFMGHQLEESMMMV